MKENSKLFNFEINPILGLVILGLLLFQIFGGKSCEKSTVNYQPKVDTSKVDSLLEIQKTLDSTLSNLKYSYDSLSKQTKIVVKNKTQIKKIYNEKITLVDSYNSVDIDSFFSNRYSQNNSISN